MDRPLRACAFPGCPSVTTSGRCPDHPVLTGADRGFYDHDWLELRNAYLIAFPWCAQCGRRASEVDHKLPVRMGGARLDWFNLRSLCHPCHSDITASTRERTSPPRTFRRFR